MSLRRSGHPAVPVAISGLVLAAAQLHGHIEVVLPVVPLLLLVVSLLFGIYPGCETIVRLAERGGRRRFGRALDQARPAPPPVRSASGGLLIAFGLAQRPPPLALQR